MRRRILIPLTIIMIFFTIFCLTSCGNSIKGTWYSIKPETDTDNRYDTYSIEKIEISEDSMIIDDNMFKYTLENDVIWSNDLDGNTKAFYLEETESGETVILDNKGIFAYREEKDAKNKIDSMIKESEEKIEKIENTIKEQIIEYDWKADAPDALHGLIRDLSEKETIKETLNFNKDGTYSIKKPADKNEGAASVMGKYKIKDFHVDEETDVKNGTYYIILKPEKATGDVYDMYESTLSLQINEGTVVLNKYEKVDK